MSNTVMKKDIHVSEYNGWSWIRWSITSAAWRMIQSGYLSRWLLGRKLARKQQTANTAIWFLHDGLHRCT